MEEWSRVAEVRSDVLAMFSERLRPVGMAVAPSNGARHFGGFVGGFIHRIDCLPPVLMRAAAINANPTVSARIEKESHRKVAFFRLSYMAINQGAATPSGRACPFANAAPTRSLSALRTLSPDNTR